MKLFNCIKESDIQSIMLHNGNTFRLEVRGEDNFVLVGVTTQSMPMSLVFTVSRTASDGSVAAILFSKDLPVGKESKDAWLSDHWDILVEKLYRS